MKIGIIGAGAIGLTLASVAVRCHHEVMISNSRGKETLFDAAKSAKCEAGDIVEAADFSDILILAIPFKAIWQLDPKLFSGKIVLDANNYYPERDGAILALDRLETTTSSMLQTYLGKTSKVVKSFNAIMQRDIESDARPFGASHRRALPIASHYSDAKQIVAELINQFGFDPLDAGTLDESWRFERAMPAYCIALDSAKLTDALALAKRGVELPHGSWRKSRRFVDV